MNNPLVFIGEPLKFCNISIYPPTVKDVVCTPNFSLYQHLLILTQDDITDEMAERKIEGNAPTPFEYIMMNCQANEQFCNLVAEAFQFFVREKANFIFDKGIIIFGDLQEVVQRVENINQIAILTADNYFDFQNAVRAVCGAKAEKKPEAPNPNEDPRIAEMKAKARKRDKLKAKQQSKNGINLMTSLVAICCMGLGITPLNIGEMSYASIGAIMSMMQEKEKYETDIKALLAGADPKKTKPKYWIRNLEETNE